LRTDFLISRHFSVTNRGSVYPVSVNNYWCLVLKTPVPMHVRKCSVSIWIMICVWLGNLGFTWVLNYIILCLRIYFHSIIGLDSVFNWLWSSVICAHFLKLTSVQFLSLFQTSFCLIPFSSFPETRSLIFSFVYMAKVIFTMRVCGVQEFRVNCRSLHWPSGLLLLFPPLLLGHPFGMMLSFSFFSS